MSLSQIDASWIQAGQKQPKRECAFRICTRGVSLIVVFWTTFMKPDIFGFAFFFACCMSFWRTDESGWDVVGLNAVWNLFFLLCVRIMSDVTVISRSSRSFHVHFFQSVILVWTVGSVEGNYSNLFSLSICTFLLAFCCLCFFVLYETSADNRGQITHVFYI